jgi:hypothetical protein
MVGKKRYCYKEREDGAYVPSDLFIYYHFLSVPSDPQLLFIFVSSASSYFLQFFLSNQPLLVLSLLSHSLIPRERTFKDHCLPTLLLLDLLLVYSEPSLLPFGLL